MSRFKPGELIHDLLSDELLLLTSMQMREGMDETAEVSWNALNLSSGQQTWIWEYILDDEIIFKVI